MNPKVGSNRFRFLLFLGFFVGWSVFCNWWYLCKIKDLCTSTGKKSLQSNAAHARPLHHTSKSSEDNLLSPYDSIKSNKTKKITSSEKEFETLTSTVHFGLASSDIKDISSIDSITKDLKILLSEDKVQEISIIGHTCDLGTEDFNYRLGKQRASSVKDYFLSQDVPEEKIKIISKGKRAPVNANGTEVERQQNRRAEILIQ